MDELTRQAVATALLALRIAPTLAFSPPFTLLRIPATVRVLLGLALAGWIAAAHPDASWNSDFLARGLPAVAASELLLGVALALALQLAFAAMLWAGRALDIQAGFGLALLADPTTRAQLPLAGTIFAYAAAAIFFSMDGPLELLAIWSASLDAVPLGRGAIGASNDALPILFDYMGAVFAMALGLAALVLLVLFLLDLAIAFMSRTLPQMNVLVLGFQVKSIAMLATLPLAIGVSGALFLRILRRALETTPMLIR